MNSMLKEIIKDGIAIDSFMLKLVEQLIQKEKQFMPKEKQFMSIVYEITIEKVIKSSIILNIELYSKIILLFVIFTVYR